jgi:hypothetical protein
MEITTLKMFTDTIQYKGTNIWIAPVCEFFQINLQNQQRKLKTDPILSKLWTKMSTDSFENEDIDGKMSTVLGEIDKNGRILLTRKGFLRWIHTINFNTIPIELQENFIMYQEMVFEFLFGTAEEAVEIARTNYELQQWKQKYSEAGTMIKKTQIELTDLLNARYQYRIDFKQNSALTQ